VHVDDMSDVSDVSNVVIIDASDVSETSDMTDVSDVSDVRVRVLFGVLLYSKVWGVRPRISLCKTMGCGLRKY